MIRGIARQALYPILLLILAGGCGKVENPFGGKEKEPERDEATVAQLRKEEDDQVAMIMAQQPKFDRQGQLADILKEHFAFDLAARYPNGLDAGKLMTPEQAKAELERRVTESVDRKYPPAQRERLVKLAIAEYPLYRVGDRVTLPLVGNKEVSGLLKEIGKNHVVVDNQRFMIDDVLPPTQYSLDPVVCQQYRDLYVRKKYDIGRKDLTEEVTEQLKPEVYRDCGFIQYSGRWVRVDNLIAKVIDPRLDQMAAKHQADLEARVREQVREQMRAHGIEPAPSAAAPAPEQTPTPAP